MQRKFLITAALVAGLAFGIVIGPSVRGIASAQDPSPTPSASASASTSPRATLWNSFLDKLAAALNIDRATLDSAIVTAGNGTADEAVANGTLTQAQADAAYAQLQERGAQLFFGRGPGRHHGHGHEWGGPDAPTTPQASPSGSASSDA